MKKTTEPTAKQFSFGGCDIGQTSPPLAELSSTTAVLNVRIAFEEALKLHLAIGECIRKLNSYKRSTSAGKRTALNLAIHLSKNRATVNETLMPLGVPPGNLQKTRGAVPSQERPAVATRKILLNLPMPSKSAILDVRTQYSSTEFELMRKGHVPVYDDKRFIYFDEKRQRLFFHRTWTGFCIYRVTLRSFNGGWKVAETLVNRDPHQYESSNPIHDAAVLIWLIDVFLLRKERDFPITSKLD